MDPYRPIFLALSAGSYGTMLYWGRRNGIPIFSLRNVLSFAVAMTLAVMPSVVNHVNTSSKAPITHEIVEVELSGTPHIDFDFLCDQSVIVAVRYEVHGVRKLCAPAFERY